MNEQVNERLLADIARRAPERDRRFFAELQKRAARGEMFDPDDDAYNARMLREFENHIHLYDLMYHLERAQLAVWIEILARAAHKHGICDPIDVRTNSDLGFIEDLCRDVFRTVQAGEWSEELADALVLAMRFLQLPEEIT